MHLMYVDESGDPGQYKPGANTKYFLLCGIIVPQDKWVTGFNEYKKLRKELKDDFGFPMRLELHGSDFVSVRKIKDYSRFTKRQRMDMLQRVLKRIPSILPEAQIINICLDKTQIGSGIDYQEKGWTRIIQRYDNYLQWSARDLGMVVPDMTDNKRITALMRKMRVFNPINAGEGRKNDPVKNIIEDPFYRDSKQSPFVQLADCIVTALRLKEYPKHSLNKKFSAHRYFDFIEPICLKKAATSDPLGVVRK